MDKERNKSPDESKTAAHNRKRRPGFDTHIAIPKGLSISSSEALAAETYYTSNHSSEVEQTSQWGGKGAALLGLSAEADTNTPPTLKGGVPHPRSHIHVTSDELLQNLGKQSPEAIALSEIALAFCKECRGWENAHRFNDFGYPYIVESVSKKLADTQIPPYERQFHYTHLDKVMAAVQDWLLTAPVTRGDDRMIAARSMRDAFSTYFDGLMDQADLCRKLMAACVEANRNRK
jgi:hypothetical protein